MSKRGRLVSIPLEGEHEPSRTDYRYESREAALAANVSVIARLIRAGLPQVRAETAAASQNQSLLRIVVEIAPRQN